MLSLSSVPAFVWRDHSFKRAGAPEGMSERQAQNRDIHLWVFLEYCIFFTVRVFFFLSPFYMGGRSKFIARAMWFLHKLILKVSLLKFSQRRPFFFLLALKVLSCLCQEVSKGPFGITEKLSKLFFSLVCILLFPRKSIWPFLLFYLFFNFLSFEEEWTGSHKMWLYIVPFSQGQIMSLKQAPNACWTPAFSRRGTVWLLCEWLSILKLFIVTSASVPSCSALSSAMISLVHGLLRNGPNQRKMHFEISQDPL